MARILCALSGIEYKCEHFPLYLTARETHHPIFDIQTKKLLVLSERWLEGELTDTENYLLYLALFNSTGLMRFTVPATQTANTSTVVARGMAKLVSMVELIAEAGAEKVSETLLLPQFVISPDTKDLESSLDWISIWECCYRDYQNKYRTSTAADKLTHMEAILERYIKDKSKDITQYANRLANWAAAAGNFEKHANYVVLDENDRNVLMKDYWKRIIVACATEESIWNIPEIDLTDIYEHCQEEIPHGSIFAHTLMSLLETGIQRQKNYTDLGNIDLSASGSTYRILDAESSVEDANKLALIDSAPVSEPRESQYPNKLAYLKAKMNWKLKQSYLTDLAMKDKIEEINEGQRLAQQILGNGNGSSKNKTLGESL